MFAGRSARQGDAAIWIESLKPLAVAEHVIEHDHHAAPGQVGRDLGLDAPARLAVRAVTGRQKHGRMGPCGSGHIEVGGHIEARLTFKDHAFKAEAVEGKNGPDCLRAKRSSRLRQSAHQASSVQPESRLIGFGLGLTGEGVDAGASQVEVRQGDGVEIDGQGLAVVRAGRPVALGGALGRVGRRRRSLGHGLRRSGHQYPGSEARQSAAA
ncbi:hypothetical protein D3C71_1515860 [compost metagenome]